MKQNVKADLMLVVFPLFALIGLAAQTTTHCGTASSSDFRLVLCEYANDYKSLFQLAAMLFDQ
jgi:hypothetical protein